MRILVACCLGLLITLAGDPSVAAEPAANPTPSANPDFLNDYDRLKKAGGPRSRYLAFRTPNAEGRAVHAIQLLPAIVAPKGVVFEDFKVEDTSALITYLDGRLSAEFAKQARVTNDAGAADIRLEVAITQIGVQEKGRNLLDLVPLRLVTGTVRNVAQGKELQAVATFESRVLDAATGAVLRERVDHVTGADIGRAGDATTHVSLEALIAAADSWVNALVKATAPTLD